MLSNEVSLTRLERVRRDQTPQALARLVVTSLFVAMWMFLWLAHIPMPVPFLALLAGEILFFLAYLYVVRQLPSELAIRRAHYCMLAVEIALHTAMVYFLGGITWLGPFAYMFGLIFANTFLDLRRGFVYTVGAASAFTALAVAEATGLIPHYTYLDQGGLRYSDVQFVLTSVLGGGGVFFSTYLWVNWVGHQLRRERDNAVQGQDELLGARQDVQRANDQLETRVKERTADLELAVMALRDSDALLKSTIESTADGILVVDRGGQIALTNARFAEMWRIDETLIASGDDDQLLGYVVEQLRDQAAFIAKVQELYQSDSKSFDTLQFKDGRVFERYSRPLMNDGTVDGRVWSFRDVSERRHAEAQLVDLANHDALTGLLNRRRFSEEIEQQLSTARRYDLHGALIFLDLDQFKDVNDSLGHGAGDEILIGLALLLRERLRESDVIARLGGDEFAILLPHADEGEACRVADEVLEAIRTHSFMAGETPLRLSASVGVALFPEHSTTAGELLSRADLAMYQAKSEGRNRLCMFEPEGDWQAAVESRVGWYQRIHEALERDLFVLLAQPMLDLRTGKVTQYELLLRAVEVNGELVLPGEFLDIAERSGLIQEIDRWVVRRAIRILGEHRAAGEPLKLSVNLSGRAFADRDLLSIIQAELSAASVDPASLILEVTETAAITNMDDAQRFMQTLKVIGCGFSLDDFGVGFSSFSRLKYLPVDYLKIDGSFIRDLPRSPVDQQLVQAIVNVARALGKQTIAEFVNDDETIRLLTEYGVDFAQGYHIGVPALLPEPQAEAAAA